MEANVLVKALNERGIEAEIKEVTKDGKMVTAISIGSGNLRPAVYPDNFTDIDDAVDFCITVLQSKRPDIDINKITDWMQAKNLVKLCIRPVTQDNLATTKLLDVELFYKVWFDENTSYSVTKDLVDLWGIGIDELLIVAMANTKTDFKIMTLAEKMNQMCEGFVDEEAIEAAQDLYFAGCNRFGASIMAFPGLLKRFFERFEGEEFYILPSSRHEVLVTRYDRETPKDVYEMRLKAMVYEINRTALDEGDFLSDNIYKLDTKVGRILMVE